MRIYVAGNWSEDRLRCKSVAEQLESYGHTITMDWYSTEQGDVGPANAILDMSHGVSDADVLVVVMDQPRIWQGTWCEVGAALITGKPVYFIGDEGKSCIFRSHPFSLDISAWPMPEEIMGIKMSLWT